MCATLSYCNDIKLFETLHDEHHLYLDYKMYSTIATSFLHHNYTHDPEVYFLQLNE